MSDAFIQGLICGICFWVDWYRGYVDTMARFKEWAAAKERLNARND